MRQVVLLASFLALVGCSGGHLGSGAVPPNEVMGSCLRLLWPDGDVRDPGRGLVRFEDFVRTVAAKPDAVLTWERYGERSYILHDVVPDRVAGRETRLDLRIYPMPNTGPTGPNCGPGQVVIDRVVLNGIEAQGFEVTRSVDAMIAKVPKGPD